MCITRKLHSSGSPLTATSLHPVKNRIVFHFNQRYNGKFVFAGVQTKMEAGFCFLNDLTVVMLTHGFATHLKEFFRCCIIPAVVIGFDGHPNSKRFGYILRYEDLIMFDNAQK